METGSPHAFYGGEDPRAIGLYPLTDAARYVRIPPATLRSWVVGRPYATRTGERTWAPIIEPADPTPGAIRLSFKNLVEAHVLSILRGRDVSVGAIREALRFIREEIGAPHPFADVDAKSDRLHVYVEHLGRLWNASKSQAAIEPVMERYLERIDRDEAGIALRLFPFTGDREVDAPKLVVIDPKRRFGRPIIAGAAIETWIVHQRWRAGESTDEIADDLDISRPAVEEALRFEDTIRLSRAA